MEDIVREVDEVVCALGLDGVSVADLEDDGASGATNLVEESAGVAHGAVEETVGLDVHRLGEGREDGFGADELVDGTAVAAESFVVARERESAAPADPSREHMSY